MVFKDYKFNAKEKKEFKDLIKLNGKRVRLLKMGSKDPAKNKHTEPEYVETGTLNLVNRGGGLSAYVGTLFTWWITSSIIKSYKMKNNGNVEFGTINSLYRLVPIEKNKVTKKRKKK